MTLRISLGERLLHLDTLSYHVIQQFAAVGETAGEGSEATQDQMAPIFILSSKQAPQLPT